MYSNLTIYRCVRQIGEPDSRRAWYTQDFLDFLPFFCSLTPESYISPTPPSNGKLWPCTLFDAWWSCPILSPLFPFSSSRDTGQGPVCIKFPNTNLHGWSGGLWDLSQVATSSSEFCDTWAPSVEQRPQLEGGAKTFMPKTAVSASNWVHLSLALFLFWFCDFSALYRNGIFWHLNKGDLSSKFSLFVSRILYYSSPPPKGTFFSLANCSI